MNIGNNAALGALIREQRVARELSQAELAHIVGNISRHSIMAIEAGKANPGFSTVLALLDELNLRVEVVQQGSTSIAAQFPEAGAVRNSVASWVATFNATRGDKG